MPRIDSIYFRRGTAAAWTSVNPVLNEGEPGYETDTGKFKLGDGSTAWAGLPYQGAQSVDKASVGLGNVDNTSDTDKPVSAVTQTALNLKAPLASPAFTGTPTGITKTHVGLGNVDNTADSAKPVSTAQQTALNAKQDTIADGSLPLAKLATTGVKDSTTVLYGDGAFRTATATTGSTKCGIFNWEVPNAAGAVTAGTTVHQRQLLKVWQRPTRFRVHMSNYSGLGNNYAGGTGNSAIRMYIGLAASDSNNEPNGNFTATPTLVATGGSSAAGAEYITGWVDSTTFALNPGVQYLLSCDFTSGGQVSIAGGLSWRNTTAQADVTSMTSPTRYPTQRFTFMWIEYEYVDDGSPFLFVVGNSRGNASNNGSVDNPGELASFSRLWAAQHRGIVASLTVGGILGANFNNAWSTGRGAIFDGTNIPIAPTAVLYQEVVSSDLVSETVANGGSASLATHRAVMGRGKTKWPNARHISTNIGPRESFVGDGTSVNATNEYARLNLNRLLHNGAGGPDQCLDFDSEMTDWANPARIRSVYDADGTHFRDRMHSRLSRLIPVGRQAVT